MVEVEGKKQEKEQEKDVCVYCRCEGSQEDPLKHLGCSCSNGNALYHVSCLKSLFESRNYKEEGYRCATCRRPVVKDALIGVPLKWWLYQLQAVYLRTYAMMGAFHCFIMFLRISVVNASIYTRLPAEPSVCECKRWYGVNCDGILCVVGPILIVIPLAKRWFMWAFLCRNVYLGIKAKNVVMENFLLIASCWYYCGLGVQVEFSFILLFSAIFVVFHFSFDLRDRLERIPMENPINVEL